MSVRRVLLAAAAVGLLAAEAGAQGATAAPAQTPEQPTRFTSAVDLVSVVAVVRDRKGRFVPGLSREDFVVVEGGQKRPIVGFEFEKDGPVKIAVLFDISGSMRVGSKVVDARQAARHVFSALTTVDQAALFAFDTQLDRVADFTTDFSSLDAAMDRVEKPYGQTSLYDAIAQTAGIVAARASESSRRGPKRAAVVVVTDGIDTKSRMTPAQVSAIASNIDVPVYIVAVMSAIDDPRNAESNSESVEISGALRNLARWTGGDLFTVSAQAHASQAARQIIGELRNQYLLAFEASTRAGWRRLEVRARDRDHVVRARSGYTAGGTRSSQESGR